jgi:glucose/arabinose dehydrogenase
MRTIVERLESRCLLTAVQPGFAETLFTGGLAQPTAMEFAPDGRLLISQKSGKLLVVRSGQLLATPFATLPVEDKGELGMLGIAFDPSFAANHFVYVYRTVATPYLHNQVTRLTADPNNPDVALPGSEVAIFDLPKLNAIHHAGGAIHFGPDGKLYVGQGDNETPSNAQSMTTPLGKMLRINKDGSIPPDNPFYNQTTGMNRAIWALGLRNPFTFALQPGTGRMFINDVGNATWEEIDDGVAGANYGWPTTEGATSNAKFRGPLYAYRHGQADETGGACIAGGAFYNPPASAAATFPVSYVGDYFLADYTGGYIKALDLSNGGQPGAVTTFATGLAIPIAGTPGPVDLKVGPDGALYSLQIGYGTVLRYAFTDNSAPTLAAPPASLLASVGHPATFSISASGPQPLSYQWQRNGVDIPGATAANYTLASAQLSDDGAQFRVIISNSFGSVTSEAATLSVTSAQPPSATINLPTVGTLYRAGDTISFSGTATDPQDGVLPASAYTWTILLHHDQHTHPFMDATSGIASGTFTIPTDGETLSNVYYHIILSVTDSAGLTTIATRDVHPRTSNIMLATNIPGLEVTLDGQPVDSGTTFTGVQGLVRTLGAPSSQAAGGTIYDFVSWSDAGASTHDIATPDADTTITAIYQARIGASTGPDLMATVVSPLPALVVGGNKGRVTVRIANSGTDALNSRAAFRLLLSANDLVDDDDLVIATGEKRLKLKPGHEAMVKVKFIYPSVEDGSYSLLTEVDPDNAIIETDEANNATAAGPLLVQRPVVDLSGAFVEPTPAAIGHGERASLILSILNGGNVTAHGPITVTLFAAADATGAGGVQIGTAGKRLKLKAGSETRVKLKALIPADLAPGTHFFAAAVDATAQIAESNESNNLAVSEMPFLVN